MGEARSAAQGYALALCMKINYSRIEQEMIELKMFAIWRLNNDYDNKLWHDDGTDREYKIIHLKPQLLL